jgi:hypothetical protein
MHTETAVPSKKVVPFKEFGGWKGAPNGALQAALDGVTSHPTLGNPRWPVLTSAVIRVEYDRTSPGLSPPILIETLNTIYVYAEGTA